MFRAYHDARPSQFDLCELGQVAWGDSSQAVMVTNLVNWISSSLLAIYTCVRLPIIVMRILDVPDERIQAMTTAMAYRSVRALLIVWALTFRLLLFQQLFRLPFLLGVVPGLCLLFFVYGYVQLFTEGVEEE